MKKPFEKFDRLAKSLKADLLKAKSQLSESDKKEIASELNEASEIALHILDSVKK